MELFATDVEVAALEARLVMAGNTVPLPLQVEPAWHLRQRDTQRALALVRQAQAHMLRHPPDPAQAQAITARLGLVMAEADWLHGDMNGALSCAHAASEVFRELGDAAGQGDACMLLGFLSTGLGSHQQAMQWHDRAVDHYGQAGLTLRQQVAMARQLYSRAFFDPARAQADLLASPLNTLKPEHPALDAWIQSTRAVIFAMLSEPSQSLPCYMLAHEAALASGQLRFAILTAGNVGVEFLALNDKSAALEWHEHALAMARDAGWRIVIGTCLVYSGHTLIALNRHDMAMTTFNEALGLLPEGSVDRAQAWYGMGDVLTELGRCTEAIAHYDNAAAEFERRNMTLPLLGARGNCVRAWLKLGDMARARQACQQTLDAARRFGQRRVESEQLELMARTCLVTPGKDDAASREARSHLELAVAVARSIDGYQLPPTLLEALALARSNGGEMAAAFALMREAMQLRDRQSGNDAKNRLAALQVRHHTERLRMEADHHRQIGRIQAQRANQLAQTNQTLEQLGVIGRDITASLDATAIFAALDRHVHRLLDAYSLLIWRIEPDRSVLRLAFGVEGGQPIAPYEIAMNDADSRVALCARSSSEVALDNDSRSERTLPGTQHTQSLLFAPLSVGDRLCGVMGVQSRRVAAYGERERAIFRNLCAYGAIALANADAQTQLLAKNVELERLATTDTLTGLFNRRFLNGVLAREVALAQRHGLPLAVIAIDLDHFKQVNDRHGHPAGDQLLAAVGTLLHSQARPTDVAGRWGGEEFMVVCPGTDLGSALELAEDLRLAISRLPLPGIGARTASLGVAVHQHGDTATSLESRADAALYAAKHAGRNQVSARTLPLVVHQSKQQRQA